MLAVLANEPFNVPLSVSRTLTPYQIRRLYFRERDDNGKIILDVKTPTPLTMKEIFWRSGELNRLKEYQIKRAWDATKPKEA